MISKSHYLIFRPNFLILKASLRQKQESRAWCYLKKFPVLCNLQHSRTLNTASNPPRTAFKPCTMTEPHYSRARRPDSKQMWDEADRRAPARDNRRDDRRDDTNRDRRYRSRSPRDSRGGRDRDRTGRDREHDYRSRDSGRGRDERGGRKEGERAWEKGNRRDTGRDRGNGLELQSCKFTPGYWTNILTDGDREARDRPRQRSRSRSRDRARDARTRDERSRSPRRDKDREVRKESEKEAPKPTEREEELPEHIPAAPVSFRVGGTTSGQDHDRMDTDEENGQSAKKKSTKVKKDKAQPVEDDEDEIIVEDDGMAAMQAMMGFGGFGTTHQKKVAGNNVSAVRKEKKTEYRQYMNRVGGFNRPLSPTRE
jgi:U4/U6.U5 tri-snRNP-associated protein 3